MKNFFKNLFFPLTNEKFKFLGLGQRSLRVRRILNTYSRSAWKTGLESPLWPKSIEVDNAKFFKNLFFSLTNEIFYRSGSGRGSLGTRKILNTDHESAWKTELESRLSSKSIEVDNAKFFKKENFFQFCLDNGKFLVFPVELGNRSR
jgi:hypothetical protein